MADENTGLTDLLGDPWTEARDPRGRKRHKRVPQLAERIAVLRASELTVEQIAARVGLSEPTLRKYYFRELENGPALAKAVLTEAVWEKAKAGNVSAARYMRDAFTRRETVDVDRRVRAREREEPIGKKEERMVAAKKVGGRFATPPAPQLVVDNG